MLKPIESEERFAGAGKVIDVKDNKYKSRRHAQYVRFDLQSPDSPVVIESLHEVTWHVRRSSIAMIEHSDFSPIIIEDIIEDVRG